MSTESPELGPIATKVLYEDDQIRIWDQRLAPGQLLPPHRHECDYLLCDVQGDLIEAEALPGNAGEFDGRIELNVRRGNAILVKKGGVEQARNIGKEPFRAILIEYKD